MKASPEESDPPADVPDDPSQPRRIPDSAATGWIRRIADQWRDGLRDDQKRQDRSGASLRR